MNLLTIGLIGAGLYLFTSSGTKKGSTTGPVKKDIDKGYTILIPCKMFDIYNEEASYEYAYQKFTEIIKVLTSKKKYNNLDEINDLGDQFQKELFGCDTNKAPGVFESPQYYAWGYRIIRSGMKALVDNRQLVNKNITEMQAIAYVDQILNLYLQDLKQKGFDIQGLPTTVLGDFQQ